MDDQQDDVVLDLKDLYVGYYKDLNILQALNIKARKNKITAILGATWILVPRTSPELLNASKPKSPITPSSF